MRSGSGALAGLITDQRLRLYRGYTDSEGKTILPEPVSDKDYNSVK